LAGINSHAFSSSSLESIKISRNVEILYWGCFQIVNHFHRFFLDQSLD
jgi:hypothetical protein